MMVINARPRFVSNGFETLGTTQRAEFLHQELVKMTNNDVNSWSLLRPMATSTENWDQNLDDFSPETFPIHTLYSGYCQDMASLHHAQSTNLSKASAYAEVHYTQYLPFKESTLSQQTFSKAVSDTNYVRNPSPMFGVDYSQWSQGRRNGSFAEFSSGQSGQKATSYQATNEVGETSFAPVGSLDRSHSPYQGLSGVGIGENLKTDRMSPSTIYSSYSPPIISVDPQSLAYLVPNDPDIRAKTWFPEYLQPGKDQCLESYRMEVSQDELSKNCTYSQQQEWDDLWAIAKEPTNNWTTTETAPTTVSPKALTLSVLPSPLSISESSPGRILSLSDLNTDSGSGDDHFDLSGPETLSAVESPQSIRRPRHLLPDSIPGSKRSVPVVPSNGPARSSRKRPLKPKSGRTGEAYSDRSYSSTTSITKISSSRGRERAPAKLLAPKRVEPKPAAANIRQSCPESAKVSPATQHRDAKDEFLIRSKLAGMSYKDIRRQGNFTEAESTLRGRFRTLTKHKTARVRKPEWCENDIRLLKKAVRKLAQGSDPSKCRVPWKQVAEYIANNGGSYHFGNATCRKRWDELQLKADS